MMQELRHRLLLKPEEAAELLALSRSTVYQLLATGELASVQVGRARRIPRTALDEYLRHLMTTEHDGSGQTFQHVDYHRPRSSGSFSRTGNLPSPRVTSGATPPLSATAATHPSTA